MSKKKESAGVDYHRQRSHERPELCVVHYPAGAQNDPYLTSLPYETNALTPALSMRTVFHHYRDHHLVYYENVRSFIRENPQYAGMSLVDFIYTEAAGDALEKARTNALLLYNHNVYWRSMKPGGGIPSKADDPLTRAVINTFGSVARFKKLFVARAMDLGIGWIWLYKTGQDLGIVRTEYHTTPKLENGVPLFTVDVWEHAYYVDYGNYAHRYVDVFLNNLCNWEFALKNFIG